MGTKNDKELKKESHSEETQQQIRDIHNLARRLPWIVVAISLLAFLEIFLEVLFSNFLK